MRKLELLGLIAFLAVSFSSPARAQRGGGAVGGAHAVAPVRSAGATHSSHVFTNVRLTGKPSSTRRALSSNPRIMYIGQGTPNTLPAIGGLGFDCQNLNCYGGNLGVEALINPSTELSLALAQRFRRFGAYTGAYLLGGYGYPYAYEEPADNQAAEEPAQPQPPQVIVIQQPVPPARPAEAEAAPAAEEPAPDVGDFTLILKNGSQISAVAFTRRKDQLVYITREGSRHTVNVADVDGPATTKLNEDRGTPLKLSI